MFNKVLGRNLTRYLKGRQFSTSNAVYEKHSCKLLVVGGGSAGCAMAAKFARKLKKNELIIVEPSETHYYQPLFTLIGGGIKKLYESHRPMASVLPKGATWLKDSVVKFEPTGNRVYTANGDVIEYDIMLIATGMVLRYDKIPGLQEAVNNYKNVGSIFSPKYVEKTAEALRNFESGDLVFTYPQSSVKCPGAPQKICYIAEDFLTRAGRRGKANITYNTPLPVIFGVKRYADALWEVVKRRNINVNVQTALVEVHPERNEAKFKNLQTNEVSTVNYSILHAVPPMYPPDVVMNCKELVVAETGYVDVKKDNLQHVKYPNVFAMGDSSSAPCSKTVAAIGSQVPVVYKHIKAQFEGKTANAVYDGYAACPLVTGIGKCILAEFDYNLTPKETFPIAQNRELWTMYQAKKVGMPMLYWNLMMKGYWHGPALLRKILHLGLK